MAEVVTSVFMGLDLWLMGTEKLGWTKNSPQALQVTVTILNKLSSKFVPTRGRHIEDV